MLTSAFAPSHLAKSVFAVPPMARDNDGKVCRVENAKIIRFLEEGGIRSLLYGGNAVFYHIRMAEYADTLQMLAETASDDTTVVPSIGPAYGLALDQIDVLRDFQFPTVMLLPTRDIVSQAGIARAVREMADRLGRPIVLYLKIDRWLEPDLVRSLEEDGAISWIKYAVVRDNPLQDDYLKEVLDVFPGERIVSGIGEQPAIAHLHDFGVTGFTSGCVCVAPAKSMEMLNAIQAGDFETAEAIRKWFLPLEDLRNGYGPIPVLHHAVNEAGIANTGPLLPMLSDLEPALVDRIRSAAQAML